ncbi:MAG TPA: gamma-glutamyltransferase [Sandaracinaceae bacterium LLY-WYZ-13_1]|nr:gamma-glutamyltransferase [Sandaracinaceae bacterium LLY-WYZ-13_1]
MRTWITRLATVAAAATLGLALSGQAASEENGERAFERYAVAADHQEGSRAGAAVLAAGGNAADAAAATMLALGVVSPASSGLGGGGFGLYYDASEGSLHYLDFRERAPGAATADMFEARPGDDEETAANRSRAGGLAVGVPGEPAGIEMLIERFGSGEVTRAEITAPAIRLADEGFESTSLIERFTRWIGEPLSRDETFGRWFPDGETVIPPGTRLTNPAHARSLRAFAQHGAEPFYRGRIARAIVRAVRAHGGIMTREDLADYEVAVREPVIGEHLGYRWVSAPPPSAGGVTMLASLALVERWVPEAYRQADNPLLRHALAESWKGPYTDRHHYMGDPDHVDVPVAALLSEDRTQARDRIFHPTLARPTDAYDLPLAGHDHPPTTRAEDHGTSHLCVVDAEGNVAAITTTVNLPFGARFSAAGIVMNDEMDDFAREVGEPNAFGLVGGAPNLPGPGRRPVSSMSPTIVFEADHPVLCIGAAGGSRIITATQQVALFSLLFGDSPGQALARRRVHHQGVPRTLRYEAGMDEAMIAALRARGHDLEELDHSATVQLIRLVRGDDGAVTQLLAGSDPRKGGIPAGE